MDQDIEALKDDHQDDKTRDLQNHEATTPPIGTLMSGNRLVEGISILACGIFVSYAPSYIGTNAQWVNNVSKLSCILLCIVSFFIFRSEYKKYKIPIEVPGIIICMFVAPFFYYYASLFNTKEYIGFAQEVRSASFFACFVLVLTLPSVTLKIYYKITSKGNIIKNPDNIKSIAAVILGIITAVTAMIQFIQALLPFIGSVH
ncbi:hypothetical protein [Dictyobacter formicarum]|uniref:Yip1 domain-containing protein n=1 Tax=Dictyobacter formicarum TaxID=2778368 RepID=A0ABQ3VVU2_9CHLR|nr:hypothetical protein [Dictyobacter formicarum]GHO89938.1 hypothetical protein KSZ_79440 [Dictyobacter formicarum]